MGYKLLGGLSAQILVVKSYVNTTYASAIASMMRIALNTFGCLLSQPANGTMQRIIAGNSSFSFMSGSSLEHFVNQLPIEPIKVIRYDGFEKQLHFVIASFVITLHIKLLFIINY